MFLSEQDRKDLKAMKDWTWKHKKQIAIGAGVLILINDHAHIKQLVKDNALLLRSQEILMNEHRSLEDAVEVDRLDINELFGRTFDLRNTLTKQLKYELVKGA
jgi:hypothetical protein